MIPVNDPYNLVPELFEVHPEFVKSDVGHVDILLVTSEEASTTSSTRTVLIDPEPNIYKWQEIFDIQSKLRPNSVLAVSGYNVITGLSGPERIPFWLNGTLTIKNNPDLTKLDYSTTKPFVANALLGGWSMTRGVMINQMQQLGLLDMCIANYFDGAPVEEHVRVERKRTYPEYFFNYRSSILNNIDHPIFKSTAFEGNDKINTCRPIPDSAFGRPSWISQLIAEQIYQQTYLSIVAETDAGNSVFFISEKIVKPLLIGHPFVVYGCKGYLAELRQLGFKTFAHWIDESYDLIDNNNERARQIINSVSKFAALSDTNKVQTLQEMQSVLEHNQQLITDLSWHTQPMANWIKSTV